MKAWKRLELDTAKALDAERRKRGDDFSQSLPDVESGKLVVECKYRKALPLWLKDSLARARFFAQGNRFPAVVVKEKHQRGAIVIMDLRDFQEWFGDLTWEDEIVETERTGFQIEVECQAKDTDIRE